MQKFIPITILQFIKIYLTVLLFFSCFRLLLFFIELERINSTVSYKDIFLAFIMGLRFDIVISSYLLILPFIALSIFRFFKPASARLLRMLSNFIFILFSIAFLVCAIDIPYFNQFFSRFSIVAFEWVDSPVFVMKMIVQEPRYWLYILPLIVFIYLFYKILKNVLLVSGDDFSGKKSLNIVLSLLFLGCMMIGIRGRLDEKSPIRIGTAYFSNNPFLNQLGLNPNFTLIRSYLDARKEENQKINFIEDAKAIANVQGYLNIQSPDETYPLLRKIQGDSISSTKPNVVLIIMESMSTAKMKRHGNSFNLTPFLDSISNKGYYFENNYTAGIHTYNGIFSTLFSFPALLRQHPMKESAMLRYHGIYSTLKSHNYSTIYFTTHDGQFDNVEGFLKANDCETVISKSDYPTEQVKTTLGVPDDFMFEFSIPVLNKLHAKNKPFFAAFITASDHGPYYLPPYFKPHNTEIKKQIVEYADYSLMKFINLSSAQSWFENTIFVFVADHGAPMDALYSMSIDYNHAPLIIYAPKLISTPKLMGNMAGQIDIFPTIMGLLNLPYTNNTLGIDLLKENRPYIFMNADDKYGVMSQNWFLIVSNDQTKGLYKYRISDTHNYAEEMADTVAKMNLYAQSNLQAFQYLLKTNKQ